MSDLKIHFPKLRFYVLKRNFGNERNLLKLFDFTLTLLTTLGNLARTFSSFLTIGRKGRTEALRRKRQHSIKLLSDQIFTRAFVNKL